MVGLDITRHVVKNEADINMDEFNSDEDEVHVKEIVHVRECKITGLENEVKIGYRSEDCL